LKPDRKTRSDSVTAMIGAMANAALPDLRPPRHCKLRKGDRPFWTGIIRSRARDEWSGTDLVVAVQLARCQADIEREQHLLDVETTVRENKRGTMVMNARVTVLEQLARRELALMRTLRLAGTVLGTARESAAARVAEDQARRARAEVESDDEDELLAR